MTARRRDTNLNAPGYESPPGLSGFFSLMDGADKER